MFGSDLRNPLYWVMSGVDTLAYLMCVILLGVCLTLLWRNRGRNLGSGFAGLGAVFMLLIGVDMTHVYSSYPVSVTVHRSTLDGGDYEATLWAHPSHLMVVLAALALIAAGCLTYVTVTSRRLLTASCAIVGLITSFAITFAVVGYQFDVNSKWWLRFAEMQDVAWDTLAVSLIALVIIAVVVGVRRGIERTKHRAAVDTITGYGSVPEQRHGT